MAEKQAVSKTKAVLEYLAANPKASNIEVSEAMSKKSVDVTPGYVANIKTNSKKNRKKARRAVKAVVAKRGVSVPEIKAALALLKVAKTAEGCQAAIAAAQEIKALL